MLLSRYGSINFFEMQPYYCAGLINIRFALVNSFLNLEHEKFCKYASYIKNHTRIGPLCSIRCWSYLHTFHMLSGAAFSFWSILFVSGVYHHRTRPPW